MAEALEIAVIAMAQHYAAGDVLAAVFRAANDMDTEAGCDAHNGRDNLKIVTRYVDPPTWNLIIAEAVARKDYVSVACADEDCLKPIAAIIGPSTGLGPAILDTPIGTDEMRP